MPTPTTKLGLKKALGSDNARTYLKTDLAGSLDTLDDAVLAGQPGSISGQWTFSSPIAITAGVAGMRLAGLISGGPPSSGAHLQWDVLFAQDGSAWLCTAAGTPGTWVQLGGSGYAIGDLKTTLRNTADVGWALCFGQTVDASPGAPYANLWNYISANGLVGGGKPFGGNQGALILPDYRGYALVGLDAMGGSARSLISGLSALGSTAGAASHAISGSELPVSAPWQMPDHTHPLNLGPNGGGAVQDIYAYGVAAAVTPTAGYVAGSGAQGLTSNGGGGQGMSLVQPSAGVNIMVRL